MSGPGRTAAPPQQAPGKAGRRQSAQRSGERPGERSGQPRRSPARVRKPSEPRDIVGSPGRPLDGGLRREMEERLGHDFSRVRIHADADAAALTELLGADAVAVGTDIFFAAGAFRPESSAGRRLLAHELLHTVQVPYAPGPLRLGREAGALSRAAEPLEVEAERAAARDGRSPLIDARGSQPASWLRYTRVTADQQRAEQLDPATLVDRLVAGLLRSLRGDPADASGRVRLQLVRIAPELRSAVLERLEVRLPSSEYARVLDLMAVADTEAGAPPEPGTVPEPVEEPADRTEDERRGAQDDERADRDEGDQRDTDHGDEQDQRAADRDRDQERADQQEGDEEARDDADRAKQDEDKARQDEDQQKKTDAEKEEQEKKEDEKKKSDDAAKAKDEDEKDKKKKKDERGEKEEKRGKEAKPGAPSAPVLGAEGAQPTLGQSPMTGAMAADAAPIGAGGAEPVREDRAEAFAEDPQGPLARHGLLDRPGRPDEARPEEQPLDVEPAATEEPPAPEPPLEPPEAAAERAEREAGEDKPPPDPVPKTDLDVSQVPTADEELRLPPSGAPPRPREAPSFPAPPPVEVEPEQQDRADAEDRRAGDDPELAAGEQETAADRRINSEADDTARASADAAAEPPEGAQQERAGGVAEPGPEPTPESEPAAEAEPVGMAEPGPGVSSEPGAGPGGSSEPGPGPAAGPGFAGAGPAAGLPGPGEPVPGNAEPGQSPGATPGAAFDNTEAAPGVGPLPQDASLEAGGGSCAGGAPPTTEGAEQGGEGAPGGGCGGGGAPAPAPADKEQAEAAPADVSNQEPQAALVTVGQLPPARMPQALGGVDQSVNRTVGDEQKDLQQSPPEVARPSGAPQTQAGPPETAPPVESKLVQLTEVTPKTLAEQRKAEPPSTPGGPNPADQVQAPNVAGNTQGQATDAEVQNMQNAVDGVPTSDPRLHQTVGAAPTMKLEGDTDPALGDEQKKQLDDQSGQLLGEGRQDAAQPLGEDHIFPNVPRETLRAQVPGGGGPAQGPAAGAAAGGPGPGPGALDPDSLSAVAQQERGPQIQAGVAQGGQRMATGKQDKEQKSSDARADNQAQITQEIQGSTDEQTAQRAAAKEQAQGRRAEWRTEQDNVLDENRKKADQEHDEKRTGILKKKTDTDGDVQKRKDDDNQRIATERQNAEADARKKRQEKKEESHSWWSKAVSAVKSAFNALVSAIKTVFDAAVKAINKIKDEFKKAIDGLIDLATKFVVDLIKGLAAALIAISGVLLAAFPGLRDKFRKFIEGIRDAAIAKVQQFADNLKRAVNKLIDALAGALVGLLRLYEKALLAAVQFVRDAVVKAIQFVENAIKLLGEFAALVKDIAPDPIGWLKKLGAAAKDGIRNYLWGAIKTAVRQWFNDKVESVLGLGKLLWNVLIKGCLSVAQIGKMAWQAIVKAIPMMIITIVVEKVVSLIIPAAGAIMTIIQGLIAAYGTISRIIAAFAKFFTFLKSVKSGGAAAACNFAQAVAAGVVALLEFITNFLLARIGRALKGVAGRLKGIAQKIMKGLKRGAKGARKAAGRAINAGRQAIRTGAQAVRRGATRAAQAVRRGVTAGARAVRTGARRVGDFARNTLRRAGNTARRAFTATRNAVRRGINGVRRATRALGRRLARTKVGRALVNGARRARDAYRRMRDRLRNWRQRLKDRRRQRQEDRDKRREKSKAERLRRIVERIRGKISPPLRRGIRRSILTKVTEALRAWYRLTTLLLLGFPKFRMMATVNPTDRVVDGEYADERNAGEEDAYLRPPGAPERGDDSNLPKPIIPNFENNVLATPFKAEFLNKEVKGQPSSSASKGQPIGWDYVLRQGLTADQSITWVRMHLLPDKLGGPAKGSNLVPARGALHNVPFNSRIEAPAHLALTSGREKMIWYTVNVAFHPDPVPVGFPNHIEAKWAGYDKRNGRWSEKTVGGGRASINPEPPPATLDQRLYINREGAVRIMSALHETRSFADIVISLRPFSNVAELVRKLKERENAKANKTPLPDLITRLAAVIAAWREGRIRFDD